MEVVVGKYSGFCNGVNYTYIKAQEELKKGQIYCLGKIIHNDIVIKELEDKGMVTISDLKEVPNGLKVIFRAHGEPYKSYLYAKDNDIQVIDLTCGRVKAIHNRVSKEKEDSFIIIIGKKTHPEIIGTVGFSGENNYVVEDFSDIDDLVIKLKKSELKKVFVISQTTFSSQKFDELLDLIKEKLKDYVINYDKSICNSTEKRQKECDEISRKSSLMIIIGDKFSSNTKELYNIAKGNCEKSFLVSDVNDLDSIEIIDNDMVGIVAGASTPKYLIDDVYNKIIRRK